MSNLECPVLRSSNGTFYRGDGYTMIREYGKTPNGNDLAGSWVLRKDGIWVDFCGFRTDLAERNGIKLNALIYT